MAEEKEWTVMVYMAGDNNLSIDMAYALNDIRGALEDMKDGTGQKKINLLAYFDSNAADVPTLYCDFTDCQNPQYIRASSVEKRFLLKRERHLLERFKAEQKQQVMFAQTNGNSECSDTHRKLASLRLRQDEENSAAMYSIMNFVDWCLNKVEFIENEVSQKGRRAKNYALIFSGHGFGFQSLTFLKDNKSNYYMTIRKLRAALRRIKDEIIGERLAILGFDSCVMSMLEVGNELKGLAKTIIASEGTIPNAGWTYGPILQELVKTEIHNDKDIFEVSQNIVRRFIETQEKFAVGGVSVDMAAWDLSKVGPIVKSVNKLGEILLKGLKSEAISHQLELILLKTHFKCQSFMFEQNVDLKDFCEILQAEAKFFDQSILIELDGFKDGENLTVPFAKELAGRCDTVINRVKACILLSGFSGGKFQYANGISLFFPWTYLIFLLSVETYDNLRFVFWEEGIYWRNFLFHFLAKVSLRGNTEIKNRSVFRNIEQNPSENLDTKTTENPATRLVEEFAGFRTTENPATRTTENPATRTTENPATRLLDDMMIHLNEFKNVATPSFVSGFNAETDLILNEAAIQEDEAYQK